MSSNQNVYESTEFNSWAYREGLTSAEEYIINKYLNQNLKTVEAGTAGGRILLRMKEMGFTSLHGYDYVPEFIEQAKKKDLSGSISFEVEDATGLSYEDCSFDQILYLQQIICSIDGDEPKLKALKEAYRIFKKNGTALFSFLCFDVRVKHPVYSPFLAYLFIYRKLRGSNRSLQYFPWLKLGGKFNFSALLDREPYIYWYKPREACALLQAVGFKILALGTTYQISQGIMCDDIESLEKQPLKGILHFVCTK